MWGLVRSNRLREIDALGWVGQRSNESAMDREHVCLLSLSSLKPGFHGKSNRILEVFENIPPLDANIHLETGPIEQDNIDVPPLIRQE